MVQETLQLLSGRNTSTSYVAHIARPSFITIHWCSTQSPHLLTHKPNLFPLLCFREKRSPYQAFKQTKKASNYCRGAIPRLLYCGLTPAPRYQATTPQCRCLHQFGSFIRCQRKPCLKCTATSFCTNTLIRTHTKTNMHKHTQKQTRTKTDTHKYTHKQTRTNTLTNTHDCVNTKTHKSVWKHVHGCKPKRIRKAIWPKTLPNMACYDAGDDGSNVDDGYDYGGEASDQ